MFVEPVAALSVLALVLAGAALLVVLARRPVTAPAPPPTATADLAPSFDLLRASLDELRTTNASALGDLRTEMQRTLSTTEQQVLTQTGATQRSLSDLSRQLGVLSEQSARVGELAKDIGSLQDLLRAPKPRGGFGELMLERLLQDCLPASAYAIPFTYRDGSRVDAVVRCANRLVPIDAKFPNESYTQIAAATDEADRVRRRRAFLQQVRRHIDAVGRYVSPHDGTIDYAFMYLPSEAIYYEVMTREAADGETDLGTYCQERHVIPARRTRLAYISGRARRRGLASRNGRASSQTSRSRRDSKASWPHEQRGKISTPMKKFDEPNARSRGPSCDQVSPRSRSRGW